ncbi:MAG: hypothetical protein Q9211_001289 [Gyalolechia sp. 1 TL-2023]
MAALWMVRCGIKTLVIDKREENVPAGNADGVHCRTMEILDSFDIIDRIWKESCHMAEMCMWFPGSDGTIRRSMRTSNAIPGISRFPCGVLLAQHRIEKIFLDEIRESAGVSIRRNVVPISIESDSNQTQDHGSHAVTVKLREAARTDPEPMIHGVDHARARERKYMDIEETVRAKYVIGCDGAHSWTRAQLGFRMEGEQTDLVWGVLDIIPLTDFPDIRSRCRVSAQSGTIMIIPREDDLVRIYCQLSTLAPGSDGRFDRSRVTPDTILEAAQKIIRPYKLEYNYRDWWAVYQIGQRVGNYFSAEERIFLAGDAIHTHSPKAGQGMNVSIQDAYNLGWKLALVAKGIAKPSILKTYETERRRVAQELISFDRNYSKLWSSPPKKDMADQSGVSVADFEGAFVKQQLFTSGFSVHYDSSILTAKESNGVRNDEQLEPHDGVGSPPSHQHLATKTVLGKRFPSFKVVNHSDARSWHFSRWLSADGFFYIVLFAGDVSLTNQMERVRTFASEITTRSRIVRLRHRSRTSNDSRNGIAQILTIHSALRQQVEFHDFPPLLRPYDEKLGYDYNRIFVDSESYYEGHGKAYEGYGVDRERGCVMVIRPDHYVAWIGELEDVQGLEAYFARILR